MGEEEKKSQKMAMLLSGLCTSMHQLLLLSSCQLNDMRVKLKHFCSNIGSFSPTCYVWYTEQWIGQQ